jgi:hypothetical protein
MRRRVLCGLAGRLREAEMGEQGPTQPRSRATGVAHPRCHDTPSSPHASASLSIARGLLIAVWLQVGQMSSASRPLVRYCPSHFPLLPEQHAVVGMAVGYAMSPLLERDD